MAEFSHQPSVKRPGSPPDLPRTSNPDSATENATTAAISRNQRKTAKRAPVCETRYSAGGIRQRQTSQAGFWISQSSLIAKQGNRILIGPSFSTDRNAAFLALVNSGFCEESRLKDALKN